jgi:hypothetical protein
MAWGETGTVQKGGAGPGGGPGTRRARRHPGGPRPRRVPPPRLGFGAQAPGAGGEAPQACGRLAAAPGPPCRVGAPARPGRAPRAPWGHAGLSPHEPERLALAGASQPRGPGLLTPRQALDLRKGSGDNARLLGGTAQGWPQGPASRGRIRHPPGARDEVWEDRGPPAA